MCEIWLKWAATLSATWCNCRVCTTCHNVLVSTCFPKHLHRLELSAPFCPNSHSQDRNDVAYYKGRKGISKMRSSLHKKVANGLKWCTSKAHSSISCRTPLFLIFHPAVGPPIFVVWCVEHQDRIAAVPDNFHRTQCLQLKVHELTRVWS